MKRTEPIERNKSSENLHGHNDTQKNQKSLWLSSKTNLIGLAAMIIGILAYIPAIIALVIVEDKSSALYFSLPIYIIALVSNCLWLPYAVIIHSIPLIIASSITIGLLSIFIVVVLILGLT